MLQFYAHPCLCAGNRTSAVIFIDLLADFIHQVIYGLLGRCAGQKQGYALGHTEVALNSL